MYDCPQCGAGLRYDIAGGTLLCDNCGHRQDPYSYEKEHDAETSDNFGVTVFICPQCGGEIMTTDVTAAAFCTYCGASTILDSRMREEKRPAHILPFTKTKEDCCEAYRRFTRSSLYTPKELRDPEYLERFRGIYMPYWVYRFDYDSKAFLHGTKSYRKGNYIHTNHYDLTCDLNASYDGLTYDASSSFDDGISLAIAPFPADQLKPFAPAFLSGFFADAPDVDAKEYQDFAKTECNTDVVNRILTEPEFSGYKIEETGETVGSDRALNTKPAEPRCAFLPVWFLTYRKKDRVAYAVMNGSTGKLTADLPVDEKKFLLGSLLLAVPLFLILNLLLTVTARTTLTVSGLLSAVVLFLYLAEIGAISKKERRERDLGYLSAMEKAGNGGGADSAGGAGTAGGADRAGGAGITGSADRSGGGIAKRSAAKAMAERSGQGAKANRTTKGALKSALAGIVSISIVIMMASGFFLEFEKIFSFFGSYRIAAVILLAAALLPEFLILHNAAAKRSETANRSLLPHTIGAAAAAVLSSIILIADPADDVIFYGGTIAALAGICTTLLGILSKYNLLATRPLPSFFDREGGDDKPVRGYALHGVLPFFLTVPLLAAMLFPAHTAIQAGAADTNIVYRNTATGYSVLIDDSADLLTENEEQQLIRYMEPVTAFGNALFVSERVYGSDTEQYAQDYYYNHFGNASGTILLIDMNARVLTLQSEGSIYRTVTRGYANSITDNIYRYASRGDYYSCASKAYAQVLTLLEGGRITQPMKYICNALLALIASLILNYAFVRFRMRQKTPGHRQIMDAAVITYSSMSPFVRFVRKTKVYDPPAKGGGGGGGGRGFSGGGGGGFSGGGGSHRF